MWAVVVMERIGKITKGASCLPASRVRRLRVVLLTALRPHVCQPGSRSAGCCKRCYVPPTRASSSAKRWIVERTSWLIRYREHSDYERTETSET